MFRADWAAVNLYAVFFREGSFSKNARGTFQQMLGEVEQRLQLRQQSDFLVGFFDGIVSLDGPLRRPISETLLPVMFDQVFLRQGTKCLSVLDGITCDLETKAQMRAATAARQLEGLLNVVQRQHGLG